MNLQAKASAEVVERRWLAPVDSDDGAASVATSASGITVDSATLEGDEVVLILSAGTVETTGSVVVTVTTSRGRVLTETLYIPIIATASGTTVQDIVAFALRKVFGIGATANADNAADAMERLQDMLEVWRVSGADIGAVRPLTMSTTIYAPYAYLMAVKNNLIVQLADLYEMQVSPVVIDNARHGLAHIRQADLSDSRVSVFF